MGVDIKKQGGRATTATERMESARSMTQAVVTRELCLAVILSRYIPTWVGTNPNEDFPIVMVLESQAGPITYRVHREEAELVAHLEHRNVVVKPQSVAEKEATLLLMAQSDSIAAS